MKMKARKLMQKMNIKIMKKIIKKLKKIIKKLKIMKNKIKKQIYIRELRKDKQVKLINLLNNLKINKRMNNNKNKNKKKKKNKQIMKKLKILIMIIGLDYAKQVNNNHLFYLILKHL